ncbi:hypothetical protein BDW67DRAFT_187279 [Aspergillus spinulosporus]
MPAEPVPFEVSEAICFKKPILPIRRYAQLDRFPGHLPASIIATFHNPDGSIVVENNIPFSFDSRDVFINFFADAFKTQQTIHTVGSGELEFSWVHTGGLQRVLQGKAYLPIDMTDQVFLRLLTRLGQDTNVSILV